MGDFILKNYPLVLRKDYDDVVTVASIIIPTSENGKSLANPQKRKIFSDTYRLIEALHNGNSEEAMNYAFEESSSLVDAFSQRYKGIIGFAKVRGLLMIGNVPVVFWSLEDEERSLTGYFVYRKSELGNYMWEPTFNDPLISMIAESHQRALNKGRNPERYLKRSAITEFSRPFQDDGETGLPVLDWSYYHYEDAIGRSFIPARVESALAAFEYSENVLKGGDFNKYASLLTDGSRTKFTRWASSLSPGAKKQHVDDHFHYEKEIKAVIDISPFVLILYRPKVPVHLDDQISTRIVYMFEKMNGEFYRTNISFEGYFDDFLKKYDPYSSDFISRMINKFLY